MRYKKFLLQVTAKKIGESNVPQNSVSTNDVFFQFAHQSFQKEANLPEKYLIQDIDQEITLFTEKFATSKNNSEKEEMLKSVALILDEMLLNNRFWFVIPYDKIYITEDNKIVFNWYEYDKYTATDQMRIQKEITLKYQDVMGHKLNSGIISPKILNEDLTKQAFIKFLIKSLYSKLPSDYQLPFMKWLSVAITKLKITPEEKYFLYQLLNDNLKAFNNCIDIVNKFFFAKRNSICIPQKPQNLIWDFSFHTEHGRNKKSIQNEDSYTIISTTDKKSLLFMVADGVSTANIGRGKIISSKILEIIEDNRDAHIQFMDENKNISSQDWMAKCKKKIIDILSDANSTCIEALNQRLKNNIIADKAPMSSTVIIGFVNKNQLIFGHLGDSHVFYIYDKKLMRLNEEHNVGANRITDYIDGSPSKKPFEEHKDDKQLERAIPFCEYSETEEKFIAINVENDITFMEFYPQEDSVLIIATDGLIDSLGTTKNEFENEKDILKTYFDAQSSNKPNDIAREMGRMADKQSGVDNITLIILSNKQEILQPVLQPDLQPVKKMKKLS